MPSSLGQACVSGAGTRVHALLLHLSAPRLALWRDGKPTLKHLMCLRRSTTPATSHACGHSSPAYTSTKFFAEQAAYRHAPHSSPFRSLFLFLSLSFSLALSLSLLLYLPHLTVIQCDKSVSHSLQVGGSLRSTHAARSRPCYKKGVAAEKTYFVDMSMARGGGLVAKRLRDAAHNLDGGMPLGVLYCCPSDAPCPTPPLTHISLTAPRGKAIQPSCLSFTASESLEADPLNKGRRETSHSIVSMNPRRKESVAL